MGEIALMAVSARAINLKNIQPGSVSEYLYKLDIGVFTMSEFGPSVLYSDLKGNRLKRGLDKENVLQNIALNTIMAMGQGHAFCEGVYDLPAGQMGRYRLMVISKKTKDSSSIDPRLQETNLVNFVFFIPKKIVKYLPHYSVIEDEILEVLNVIHDLSGLVEDDFQFIKQEITKIIDSYCYY